jgi:putative SOS response-associated peptidase YedK
MNCKPAASKASTMALLFIVIILAESGLMRLATFNARVEGVEAKPTFRNAFKSRRCIIPASGFFEWTGPKTDRTPHYFSDTDGQILAFAGLWDRWEDESGATRTNASFELKLSKVVNECRRKV